MCCDCVPQTRSLHGADTHVTSDLLKPPPAGAEYRNGRGGVKGERCPRPIEFQREISSLCLGRGGGRKKQKLWFGEVGEKKKRPNKRKEKTASCHFMNSKQKETKNDSD